MTATEAIIMKSLYEVGGKMRSTMGFALMVAFLSLGAIGGCDDGNDGNTGPAGPPGSDGSDGFGSTDNGSAWDYAWFFSGGTAGPYTDADVDKTTNPFTSNGADPSCGGKDTDTFTVCVTGNNAAGDYDVSYGSAYTNAVETKCGTGDGSVQLINPPSGQVAALEHGGFNVPLAGAICTSGKWDPALGPDDKEPYTVRNAAYVKKRNNLTAVMAGCGTKTGSDSKGYTTLVTNTNGTQSCVISKEAFSNAGISLPSEDGEQPVSNDGIAIGYGHGLGHGACGSAFFTQQGLKSGSTPHKKPGNTVLLFQLGERAWSGEWTDTINGQPGYLQDGSNTPQAEGDSQSCLQPRFRALASSDFDALFVEICGSDGCEMPPPTGTCVGGGICAGQTEAWCKAAEAGGGPCSWAPLDGLAAGETLQPTYGDLALEACAKVETEKAAGGTCGDACLYQEFGTPADTKTVHDLAKIWTYSTSDMQNVAGQPLPGGSASCVGAVAVALGECQVSNVKSGVIANIDSGGCSSANSLGLGYDGKNGSGISGGMWQQSGPLLNTDWEGAGSVTVDGKIYNCAENAPYPAGYPVDPGPPVVYPPKLICTTADTSCGGWGPTTSAARTPVCQARLTFAKVRGEAGDPSAEPPVPAWGCARAPGTESIPLCLKTPSNQQVGRAYLDLAKDLTAELKAPGFGLACWADSLCVTGIAGGGQWPGASSADGQTNSFGHYYKSCSGNGVDRWIPWEGNPYYVAAKANKNWSDWTATDNGNCAASP